MRHLVEEVCQCFQSSLRDERVDPYDLPRNINSKGTKRKKKKKGSRALESTGLEERQTRRSVISRFPGFDFRTDISTSGSAFRSETLLCRRINSRARDSVLMNYAMLVCFKPRYVQQACCRSRFLSEPRSREAFVSARSLSIYTTMT